MEVFLIRHGIAQEKSPSIVDSERSLTKEGRQKTEKVAQRLVKLGIRFDLIITSPLVRAKQTAEILKNAGLGEEMSECSHLAPEGNIYKWLVDWLEPRKLSADTRMALVGHEPDLSHWGEYLVWGEPKANLVLKKAGIIGLLFPETGTPLGRSQMFWLTPPKYLL